MIHINNSHQYASLTDEQLIQQVWPNQPSQCIELLYNRYANKVYNQCSSMINNLENAQDFTHDIFLKVVAKLDSFQGRAKFSTWLFSLTNNYCIDQIRARKRSPFVGSDHPVDQCLMEPEKDTLHEERLQLVYMAMARLTPKEELFLRLKYEQNLTAGEIATLFSMNRGTTKMQIHRSQEKIQRLLVNSPLIY